MVAKNCRSFGRTLGLLLLCLCCASARAETTLDAEPLPGYESYEHEALAWGEPLLQAALGDDLTPIAQTLQCEQVRLEDGTQGLVLLITLHDKDSSLFGIPMLVVDTGKQVLCEPLTGGGFESVLFFADLNGDGFDEAIFHSCVGLSGGMGSYAWGVYSLGTEGIDPLFDSGDVDTGYRIVLQPRGRAVVGNVFQSNPVAFALRETTLSFLYDSDWKPKSYSYEMMVDTAYELYPVTLPSEGSAETSSALALVEYCSLVGHSDHVGTAYTLLRYNPAERLPEVAQAMFHCSEEVTPEKESALPAWVEQRPQWFRDLWGE